MSWPWACRCCGGPLPRLPVCQEHEAFCAACGGRGEAQRPCRICDGLALERAKARTDQRQKDLFR